MGTWRAIKVYVAGITPVIVLLNSADITEHVQVDKIESTLQLLVAVPELRNKKIQLIKFMRTMSKNAAGEMLGLREAKETVDFCVEVVNTILVTHLT